MTSWEGQNATEGTGRGLLNKHICYKTVCCCWFSHRCTLLLLNGLTEILPIRDTLYMNICLCMICRPEKCVL